MKIDAGSSPSARLVDVDERPAPPAGARAASPAPPIPSTSAAAARSLRSVGGRLQSADPMLRQKIEGLLAGAAPHVLVAADKPLMRFDPENIAVREILNDPARPDLSIATCFVAPGVTTALHALSCDEQQRIVRGSGVVELDGKRIPVRAGDVVVIPRGVAQRITNTGPGELELDCICTPRFTPERYTHIADSFTAEASSSPRSGVLATVPRFGAPGSKTHAGKVALVTGGNRGIGLETCRQLGREGFAVVLAARDAAAGEAAAQALRAEGHEVSFRALDVEALAADAKKAADFARELAAAHGRLDVLVNNAGAVFDAPGAKATDVDPVALQRSFAVNTLGPMALTKALVPLLSEARGRVVNLSSELAARDAEFDGLPAYRMAKAALNAQSRELARELGEAVSVNCVNPGWVKTRMGGDQAPDSLSDAIQPIVWLATTETPPTGAFVQRGPSSTPGSVSLEKREW